MKNACFYCQKNARKNYQSVRLPYLESLRGVAAIFVLLNHLSCVFWNNLYTEQISATAFEKLWIKSPLNAITNGNLPVQFFFVLSGFLITRNVYTKPAGNGLRTIRKKYTGLLKLIIPGILFSFLLMRFGLMFHQKALVLDESLSFVKYYNNFYPSLVSVPLDIGKTFVSGSDYNGPLWTMHFELLGSLFVTVIAAFVFQSVKGFWPRKLAYVLFYVPLCFINLNYGAFLLGALTYDLYSYLSQTEQQAPALFLRLHSKSGKWILLLLGLYFATINMNTTGIWYPFHLLSRFASQIRAFGVCLCLVVLMLSKKCQSALSISFFVRLGKLSRYIYIFHWPIVLSAGCFVYLRLSGRLARPLLLALIVLVCILLTLAVSALYDYAERKLTAIWQRHSGFLPSAQG